MIRIGRGRLSLRARFLLAFIALITVLAVLITVFAGYRFAADLEHQIWKRGQALAESLAREAFLRAVIQRQAQLATVAESFVSGEVIYVQIVHDGQVLGEKVIAPVALPVHRLLPGLHAARQALPDGTPYVDIERSFVGREVNPQEPSVQRELVGSYVRLGLSLAPVYRQIERALWVVAGVSLGVILLGAVLVSVLYRRIWRPIEHISGAMERFGQGEGAVRARVHSGDELEALARAFNQMADAIVKKDKQMHQVNLELQRANRAKSDFLAAMSHDLKTPLHVISGYAQLLLEGDGGRPSAVQRAHLSAIVRSADQLLHFIERILRFSKVDAGEEPLKREPVPADALTEEVVESLRPLAVRKGLKLDLEARTGTTLSADPAKLKQVLVNLVENAIKYTEAGWVRVRMDEEGRHVRWRVQDSGPGIPQRYQAFIFEPFGRAHASQAKMIEGMGLGLAIVKRYVERHGGRVTVDSAPGRGSTFVVWIPKEVRSR